jgi:soluble P-type ATPase
MAKISFDYDGTLTTAKGKLLAQRYVERGDAVYVISARDRKLPMLDRADQIGILPSRVFATGSNEAKIAKVKELRITKHYDNNPDVVKELPGIGILI